jgi:hypothetical protein
MGLGIYTACPSEPTIRYDNIYGQDPLQALSGAGIPLISPIISDGMFGLTKKEAPQYEIATDALGLGM